jgi:ferredoxin
VSSIQEHRSYRAGFDQPAWDDAVEAILPDVHPVDREATRIWFCFWPLKLARIAASGDPDENKRRHALDGCYRLSDQIDSSVEMFYGRRFWPEVKREVLSRKTEPEPPSTPEQSIREVASGIASAASVSDSIVLGIAAAGLMVLQQLGDLKPGSAEARRGGSERRRSPEAVLAERGKQRSKLWTRLLAGRTYVITWDETRVGRTFEALAGQNLTMAAALDPVDHRARDSRCIEGPIPVQCRSGACGYCWVGVIAGREGLSEITPFERERLEEFGYASHADGETHPAVRLACQCRVEGSATLVLPPWNGVLQGRL